jgi:hypothetical protein
MLNMKKGLAIVLAAATALTFAPVSTLGLTGVVEAQATEAEINPTTSRSLGADTWDPTGTNKNSAVNGMIPATEMVSTVDLTASTGATFVTVALTGSTTETDNSKFTIANDNPSSVTISDLSEVPADGITITGNTSEATTKKLVLSAKKVGVSHIKVTSVTTENGGKTNTQTLELTITVNDYVSTVPTFAVAGNTVTSVSGYVGAANSKTVNVKFPNELVGNKFYYQAKNTTVSDVAAKTDTVAANGTNVTVPMSAAGETVLEIYKKQQDATGGKSPIAILPIKVNSYSFNVTASNLVKGTAGRFAITSVDAAQTKIAIKNAAGDDVTSQFTLFADNSGEEGDTYLVNPVSANANSETAFWVRPDSAVAGTYTVTVTQGAAPSKTEKQATFTVSDAASSSDADVTDNTKSDVYGGVTSDLIATDNTTYSLVNGGANFKLDGTWYTADQLKWYLTMTPSTTPVNMGFTQGSAVITESGAGKLDVKVNNAAQFKSDVNNAYIVGVYTSGAENKVVCQKQIHVTDVAAGVVTRTYDAGTITKNLEDVKKNPVSKDFLDGITLIGTNNKFLNGSNSTIDIANAKVAGAHFSATLVDAAGAGDNAMKTSTLNVNGSVTRNGVYYEKFYVPYTDTTENVKFVAEITVKVSVNAGPKVEVKDGNFVYSNTTGVKDDTKVIDLDLTKDKTFDLASRIYSDTDNTTYSYSVDTQNVTVDAKGIVTAAKVGTAVVTITPKANGVEGGKVYVFFRVNQSPVDSISVTGKDGDKATVLTTRQFNANEYKLTSEKALAAAQVGYVQVEVTGDETVDVKEALTVKGAGTLSYSLVNEKDKDHASIDSKTGVISIPHSVINSANFSSYVFPVKVVSAETKDSALTTGYFYVVVDYPDAKVTGLENSYQVGTSNVATSAASWLNLGLSDDYGPVHVSSNAGINTEVLDKYDDLDDSKLYETDDQGAFVNYDAAVARATKEGATEHILVTAGNAARKIGNTYKVVEVKSVAGQANYVTKIENIATGKTIYQSNGVTSGASIVIDKTTVVKVTVAHAPSASLNPKYDPAFTIGEGTNQFNYNTLNYFVAATENPKTYEITLIPSQVGTQIVSIAPTEGRLSETDYSLVSAEDTKLAVKYDASQTPGQVKSVKVKNAKCAKVTVTFAKENTNKNMKYYVQKKIGKKTSGKSVASTKASLSVKKGATVKVRVKAYYYDANGVKHVGKYSSWKTLKTDKK